MKSENNKTKIQLMGEIAELKNKLSAKNKELLKQKKINQTFQNKNEELEEQIIEQSFIENNISDFIYRHDINGIFYYLSPTVEKITGYSLDEWGNHYTTYLTDNPINEKVKEYTEATLATGEINPPYRIELFHKNGTPIILEINERPYFHHNKVAGIVGVARDITKKIKQEKELAESRDKISRLINNLPGIVYRCKNDKDWTMEFMSDGCYNITGYPPSDFINSNKMVYNDIIHPEDSERIWKEVQDAVALQQSYTLEFRIKTASRKTKWVWGRGEGVFSHIGELVALEGIILDITGHKWAEEQLKSYGEQLENLVEERTKALKTSEKKLEAIFNTAAVGILVTSLKDSKIFQMNDKFCEIVGYSEKELREMKVVDFTHPDDIDSDNLLIQQIFSGDIDHFTKEKRYIKKDGSIIWGKVRVTLIKDDDGNPLYSVAALDDITIHKLIEDELEEQRVFLSEIINGTSAIICGIAPNSATTFLNPAGEKVTGYSSSELLGKNWWHTFYPGKEYEQVEKLFAAFEKGDVKDYEMTLINKYDERKIISWNSINRLNKKGEIIEVIGFGHDITEKKKIEEKVKDEILQRRQAEEQLKELVKDLNKSNKELEEFAYVVSHDLKAPLRGISSLADWLYEDYNEKLDEQGKEYINKLLTRTSRMHNFIDGILKYSRIGRIEPALKEIDSGKIIEEVIHSIDIPKNIYLTTKGSFPKLVYDKILLSQVFQNLISNAIKYMDKSKGKIVVMCEGQKNVWKFCVKDNGMGIEERHFERIFKIFQSLKPRSEINSTGIGLSLIKKIVESNGGKVWVKSKLSKGSSFYFTILKSSGQIEHKPYDKILILDDNKQFVEIAEEILKMKDINVFKAYNGRGAYKILEENIGAIDLVLFDVSIEGEDAIERFKKIKNIQPQIEIVICTGAGKNETVEKLLKLGAKAVLNKPFRINEFNQIIQSFG